MWKKVVEFQGENIVVVFRTEDRGGETIAIIQILTATQVLQTKGEEGAEGVKIIQLLIRDQVIVCSEKIHIS